MKTDPNSPSLKSDGFTQSYCYLKMESNMAIEWKIEKEFCLDEFHEMVSQKDNVQI